MTNYTYRKQIIFIKLFIFLNLIFQNVYAQNHPGTGVLPPTETTICGGCAPVGWTNTAGSPDMSDASGWGLDKTAWSKPIPPVPNGETIWLSAHSGENSEMTITGLTVGVSYTLSFYYMSVKGTSGLGFTNFSNVLRYQINGSATITRNIATEAVWYKEDATFTATSTTAKFVFIGGSAGFGGEMSHISFAPNGTQPTPPDCTTPVVTVSQQQSTICKGESVTLTAGGADSIYHWVQPDVYGSTLSNYAPTETTLMTLRGFNKGGCSANLDVFILVNDLPIVSVNSPTICTGQSATLTASGADTYSWTPSTNLSSTSSASVTASPTPAPAYTVTGTTNGCVGTAVSSITVSSALSIAVNNETICTGQNATLTASGADSYVWSDGVTNTAALTASPTSTTSYTVTGTSNAGCSGTGVGTITVTSLANASFSYSPATVCKTGGSNPTPQITGVSGGVFSISPSSGITISSSTGIIDLASANVGTYTVTYTISGACGNSETFVVSIVNAADASFSFAGPYCEKGSSNPSPTFDPGAGAGTFSASPGGLNFVSTSTGEINLATSAPKTYTVKNTIAASGSCLESIKEYTVVINPAPSVTVDSKSTCSGQQTTLTAGGADSYSWSSGISSGNTMTDSPTNNTSYTVTGTTAGCIGTAVGNITVTSNSTITVNNATICSGQTATLTASGSSSYSWSTGFGSNPLITPALTADASYTVTSASGACSNSAIANVTVVPAFTVTVNAPTICSGQTATLTPNGASSYSWSDGINTIPKIVNPTTPTSYTVTGKSGNCEATAVALVTVNQYPDIKVSSVTVCKGQQAKLTASGGDQYVWSNTQSGSELTVTPTANESYTVTGTTANCSKTAVGNIAVSNPPTVTAESKTICSGAQTTLIASGAGSYMWSNNVPAASNPVSPTATTSYTVIGNPGACPGVKTVTVTVNATPTVTVNSQTICIGDTATLSAVGAATYAWLPATGLDAATGQTVKSTSSSPITYTVTGTSTKGCTKTAVSNVVVNAKPIITTSGDVNIVISTLTPLNATGGSSYSWAPADGLNCTNCASPVASPTVTTNYCVTVVDANNCVDSACLKVDVYVPCVFNEKLEVPNAFSPNSDGSNDYLVLHGWGDCIKTFRFAIFNRWGEKVFETDTPETNWDGTYKGKPLDPAVFVYFIDATFIEGQQVSKKGNITLIR